MGYVSEPATSVLRVLPAREGACAPLQESHPGAPGALFSCNGSACRSHWLLQPWPRDRSSARQSLGCSIVRLAKLAVPTPATPPSPGGLGGMCWLRPGEAALCRGTHGTQEFLRSGTPRDKSPALSHGNDPSAGSPTETLLRLLLPLNDQVRPSSPLHRLGRGTHRAGTNPRVSLNHSIGSSDGRCVQRAGT